MSITMISVLCGLLVLLLCAFFYSLTRAEKVDIRYKLGEEEYINQFMVSNTVFGQYCSNVLNHTSESKISSIATTLGVDMREIQRQIKLAKLDKTISAVEILALKIIGIIAGAAIGAFAIITKELIVGLLAIIAFVGLFYIPMDKVKDKLKDREGEILNELPEFIEQVYLCIEAGAPLQESLRVVAEQSKGVLGDMILTAFTRASYGGGWENELYELAVSTDIEPLEDFINDILISHAKGTSIHETLRREVEHMNIITKARQKEMVNALESKMILPITVFFLLPAGVIIFVPVILQALEVLS